MSKHKLHSLRCRRFVLMNRFRTAIEQGTSKYTVARNFSFAMRLQKAEIYSRIKTAAFTVNATSPNKLIIESANQTSFGVVNISQKPKYCSLYVQVWANKADDADRFESTIRSLFSKELIGGPICGIQWAYASSRGIQTVYVEEVFEDVVSDKAYPSIVRQYGSLKNFVTTYLNSDESILVLQGTPGTGKSRLIRYILAALSMRTKGLDQCLVGENGMPSVDTDEDGNTKSLVLYTSDAKALDSEELYAKFIVGEEFVFVVEDADHVLRPRSDGNLTLHHFLTISDGIIRNVGRKVIFTTNLPNIGDIDDALIRPGRCFARFSLPGLTKNEAFDLLTDLTKSEDTAKDITTSLYSSDKSTHTLAEIYKSLSEYT
jgi:hypothetical protein